jgi:Nucleotide modification associated domain 3
VKIILSRKGFDTSSGGGPSPILPDGRPLSLPIPDARGGVDYESLAAGRWGSYGDVMDQLGIARPDGAHFDPDVDRHAAARPRGWKPAFGQAGAAQRHLENQGVGVGDVFLFFGLFRPTIETGGALRWAPGAPLQHVIWGYMQIGSIHSIGGGGIHPHLRWAASHPHLRNTNRSNNTLYVASDSLAAIPELPGAGVLMSVPATRLTTPGQTPSSWTLPAGFAPPRGRLSFHGGGDRWGRPSGGKVALKSVARGQEFVIEAGPALQTWAAGLISGACLGGRTL